MTDAEIQRYANANVRIRLRGQSFEGKLVEGFGAQLEVDAPYAIRWYADNAALGVKEERITPIRSADDVESIEVLNEARETRDEIEEDLDEKRTPG